MFLDINEGITIGDSVNTNTTANIDVVSGQFNGSITYGFSDISGLEIRLKPLTNGTFEITWVNETVNYFKINGIKQNNTDIFYNFTSNHQIIIEWNNKGYVPIYDIHGLNNDLLGLIIIVIGTSVIAVSIVLGIVFVKKWKQGGLT